MDYSKLIEEITIFDLEEKYQDIAEVIGIDNFMDLCEIYGGGFTYIPTIQTALTTYLYKKALAEYDGTNLKKTANKYGFSESTMRRLLKVSKIIYPKYCITLFKLTLRGKQEQNIRTGSELIYGEECPIFQRKLRNLS